MAGVPPPPRQLEVRRFAVARAGELRSLHNAISARLDSGGLRTQQPRSARRRTTGHLPSKRRRRSGDGAGPREGGTGAEDDGSTHARKHSRAVRRRRELAGNPAEGFSVAGDGARRLRTHLWHAKRFSMERHWGFVLPVGAQGRGRGSRSVLKRLKNGTIVHDASYFVPIQLDGPEDSLLSILRMVLRPPSLNKALDLKRMQDQVMRGVCFESAMLWDVGSPCPQIIGPVSYMWRPFSGEYDKLQLKEGDMPAYHNFDEERSFLLRQLWIWIHPAALDEGFNVIRYACEKQIENSGAVVKCCSLVGKIARLDVMGNKAIQSLKRILHPIINSSTINMVPCRSNVPASTDAALDSSNVSHLSKASLIDHAGTLQPCAILSMIVHDPREVSAHGASSDLVKLKKEIKVLDEDAVPNADEAPPEAGNIFSSMWMHPGRHDLFLTDCSELWDSSHNINPPVAEEVLCMEKHHERMKFFFLDSGNDQGPTTQEKGSLSRSCPVILLKHAKEGTPALGWSIVLPLSWVKPFWFALVSDGAHVIGLRERRWIATKFKIPCFPYDFPDSKAYASFMAKQAAVMDKKIECRPAAKRPPRVHVPPLWQCIKACFGKGGGILRGLEVVDGLMSAVTFESGGAEPLHGSFLPSLQLNVPRTIQTLREYVKEFGMTYLSSSSGMETDTEKSTLVSNSTVKLVSPLNELCLTRVLIRAFKEGSLEEGAVVCAPFLSDLSAWKIRSEEEEEESVEKWELQLPQSHVSSYFSWLDSSTTTPQLPEDDAAREAFRWPIGFVTSGFVHGSCGQDAVAVAFCETKLLAMLRQQQWAHEDLQSREICVLVRNARSAAYRRALATVVLEQQETDLEFL